MHILIVEDEKHNYQIAKRALDESDLTCETTWVSRGEQALERLQSSPFDVVLIDFELPGISGLETLGQIIAQDINIPIIFVAGLGNESVAVEALDLGAQDYLIRDPAGEYLELLPALVRKAHVQWEDGQARKQAVVDIRRRTAQLEALRAVSLELAAQLDLDTLLYSIVSRAIELLDGTEGGLYLYQAEQDVLRLAVATGPNAAPIGTILHRGEGLSGKVLETGKPLVVDNYQHWEGQSPTFIGHTITSIIGVPIHWGQEFLGTLNVITDTPSTFSQADADLLNLLAAQAAIAIRNARLYEESQWRSLEQETVGRIIRALNTLDVHDAFPVLVDGLQTLTTCDRVSLALRDETGEQFIMSTLESPFPVLEEGTLMPISATAAAEDIVAGRIHTTPDLSTETDFPGERMLYQAGFRSRINLPLLVGGEIIGALNLASRQPAHFQEDQLPVLLQTADALASAVENGRLFRAEQRLRQEADTLREATLALTSALDQTQVIERILAQLQQVVPYDTCTVQLLRKSSEPDQADRLEIVGGRGFPNLPDLLGVSFVIGGDNPNSEVIRRQSPVIVADVPTEYADFRREPHNQAGIHSWLGVQMLIGKRLVGMIALDKQERGFYTQEYARLAQAFAAQAAIAVENARLYERARQDAKTRTVLLDEVNHRVKNNLTGILGLLYAARSSARVKDQATYQATMDDLIGRVRGLSTVHNMLSASEWSPLPLSDLAAQIIRASLKTLPHTKRVSVNVTPSPVRVTSDQAHNLALAINELSTNTIKYALRERDSAQITFQITLEDETTQTAPMVRCEFRDDGPGYPEDVLQMERHNVGFDLIQHIVHGSLHGELSLYNNRGAVAILRFQTQV